MRKSIFAAGAALAVVSSAAFATVTLYSDGTGFVGKGDVQIAFGWNNAAAQKNQNGVSFTGSETSEYDVTCEWDTVTGGKESKVIHHTVTNSKKFSSAISFDARNKVTGQYTGWFLTGSTTTGGGTAPEVGGTCPQNGSESGNDNPPGGAMITAVDVVSGPIGTLFANFGGVAKPIYYY